MNTGPLPERDRASTGPLSQPEISDPTPEVFVEERPWGRFQQLCRDRAATVKIITVAPGHRLSLQRHARRGELWQVLDGAVELTVADRTWTAQPGELTWVPVGAVHRISNGGSTAVRILEVALGEFDEDDIERLEDDYSRRS